ncbi:hypothetical protein [Ancylomarina sp. 16SWW S1-10-2]|uniref:hypothetical protein n=1 Tax=Ancylomarina sp. 16SWW S1-10-2 TaxID=2499681 RepID=UPI0012AE367D|nr:hypothetical protein [Ancylomarina sp. 16SWW S1-10-2]MRT93354.1 hypothetical protein [Ancylomarina sp. 16SWW S1-10-2]
MENKKAEQSGQAFLPYQGKRINKLIIDVIPPFKPNYLDTIEKTRIWIEKSANRLHNTSSKNHIRRLLYFKEGDTLDAFNTAENERLIRNLSYIKDAHFIVVPVMGSTELIDLYLLVKDQFSWGFDIDAGSLTSTSVELYNRNLYGRGHEIKAGFEYNSGKDPQWGYTTCYDIENFKSSHINIGVCFSDNYKKSLTTLSLQKQFETYMTKYAGGLTLSRTRHSKKINSNDPILNEEPLDFDYASNWFGRSYKLPSKDKLYKKQILATIGYSSINFSERPTVDKDLNIFFHNKRLYLTSLTLRQTKYFTSNLIYNFGRTEDIPFGYSLQVTTGLEDGEFSFRKYLAFEYKRANYYKKIKTYLFTKYSISGFFDKSHYEQGYIVLQNKLISRLRKLGRYRFRNFLELNYDLGINRLSEEFITLNTDIGISEFKSLEAIGTQRLTLKFEQITFTPFIAGGFKFAFFNFIDVGTIGSNKKSPFKNSAYYGFGLGLRLNNENLVFKTIELRLSIYPRAPHDFSSTQYGISGEDRPTFSDFSVDGPEVIDFE